MFPSNLPPLMTDTLNKELFKLLPPAPLPPLPENPASPNKDGKYEVPRVPKRENVYEEFNRAVTEPQNHLLQQLCHIQESVKESNLRNDRAFKIYCLALIVLGTSVLICIGLLVWLQHRFSDFDIASTILWKTPYPPFAPEALDLSNQTSAVSKTRLPENLPVFNRSNYIFVSKPLIYHEAMTYCQDLNSTLTSVHSWLENMFLVRIALDMMDPVKPKFFGLDKGGYWIGGEILKGECKFQWTDNSTWDFDYWHHGQPSPKTGQLYNLWDTCAEVEAYNSGLWINIDCAYKRPFICKLR